MHCCAFCHPLRIVQLCWAKTIFLSQSRMFWLSFIQFYSADHILRTAVGLLQGAHRRVDKSQQQEAHPAPGLSLNPLFMTRVHPRLQGGKRKEKKKKRWCSYFGPSCSSKAYKRKESINKQTSCLCSRRHTNGLSAVFQLSFDVFQVVKLYAMSLLHWFSPFFSCK